MSDPVTLRYLHKARRELREALRQIDLGIERHADEAECQIRGGFAAINVWEARSLLLRADRRLEWTTGMREASRVVVTRGQPQ